MKLKKVAVIRHRGATLTYFRSKSDSKPTEKPGSLKAFAAKRSR